MDESYGYKGHSGVLASLPPQTIRLLWYILLVICVPFIIKTAIYQDYILLSSFLLFLSTSSVYLYFLNIKKIPPISIYTPLFCMCLTLSLAVCYTGIQAIFWSYPIIIVCYFIVSVRLATIFSMFMMIMSGIFLYLQVGIPMTFRYVFSVIVVCVLVRIMINFVLSLKDELVTLSTIDPLTGAYNRRHMDEQLKANLLARPVATLLLIDIDHFKQVNDTYGHDAGDDVLRLLVSCLKENSRANDLVFRMGGEEFVMLLAETNSEQASIYANFLREKLAKIAIDNTEKTITVSIGASELSKQESSQDWLKQADICLYQAKSQGRNQVIVHG